MSLCTERVQGWRVRGLSFEMLHQLVLFLWSWRLMRPPNVQPGAHGHARAVPRCTQSHLESTTMRDPRWFTWDLWWIWHLHIIESNKKSDPISELLGLNDYDPLNKSWDVQEWLAIEKYKVNDHKHHDHSHDINRHGDNIESFSLVTNQQISMTTFNFFI